jgi:hypothetical protein
MTLKDLGYLKDETVQGVLVDRTYTVNWPDAWEPQTGTSFTLEFSHSPVLEDYSSLAIDWNGTRLASVLLSPDNIDHGMLNIEIPAEQIEAGYNQLKVEFYMGIYDDPCEDPNNPATWATIHSSSFFEFLYIPAEIDPDLNRYPLPLVDSSDWIENQLTIIIPDEPTTAEINALAVLGAKLGQHAAWRTLNIDVISDSWQENLGEISGHILHVGRANRLSRLKSGNFEFIQLENDQVVTFQSVDGVPLDTKAGIIWEQVSRYDAKAVEMIVTGLSDEAVLLAARGLASEEVYKRLHGQLGVVYEVPELPQPAEEIRQIISLEELGFADQTARGTIEQTINFIIPLSMEWQVLTEATLDLHFAHSELLHPQRSSLTILVNDSPIASVLLNEENSENGNAVFNLSARLLKIGDNKISIVTNIKMRDYYIDPRQCIEDYYHEAWVVVYADSSLTLPSGPSSPILNLTDYPFAFIGAANLSDTIFVVPDRLSRTIAYSVANVASRLGRSAEGATLYPKVISARDLSLSNIEHPYQFLFGRPTENQSIYPLNDILPLPYIRGSDKPQAIDEVAQILPLSGSTGYIQAALTDENQPRLVITGDSNESVMWAAEALSQPDLINDLKGDLVIMDARESIYTAYINKPDVLPIATNPIDDETAKIMLPPGWVIWLSGGLFVVTLIILTFVLWSYMIKRRQLR